VKGLSNNPLVWIYKAIFGESEEKSGNVSSGIPTQKSFLNLHDDFREKYGKDAHYKDLDTLSKNKLSQSNTKASENQQARNLTRSTGYYGMVRALFSVLTGGVGYVVLKGLDATADTIFQSNDQSKGKSEVENARRDAAKIEALEKSNNKQVSDAQKKN